MVEEINFLLILSSPKGEGVNLLSRLHHYALSLIIQSQLRRVSTPHERVLFAARPSIEAFHRRQHLHRALRRRRFRLCRGDVVVN